MKLYNSIKIINTINLFIRKFSILVTSIMNCKNVFNNIIVIMSLICVLTALSTEVYVIRHQNRRLSFYPYEIPKTTPTSNPKLMIENSTNNMSSNNQQTIGLFSLLLINHIILKYLNFYFIL